MIAASSSADGGVTGTAVGAGAGGALAGDDVGAGAAGVFGCERSPCGRVGMNNARGSDVDDAISNFCACPGPGEQISAIKGIKTLAERRKCVARANKARYARTVFEQPQPIAPITN